MILLDTSLVHPIRSEVSSDGAEGAPEGGSPARQRTSGQMAGLFSL